MAAIQRFLAFVSGKYSEVVPATVGGAASAGMIPALDATTGTLPQTMMPTGVGPDTQIMPASEALSAGALVNVYNNSGTGTCRNADGSTTGKQADGFVLAAVAANGNATVFFSGLNTSVSGLTPGVAYLSASAVGGVAAAGAASPGQTYQEVGVVTSAGVLQFDRGTPVVRA